MIIMIPMKSSHPLNSKNNRIMGVVGVFEAFDYQMHVTEKYKYDHEVYFRNHIYKEFRIDLGLWTIPFILGIALFCSLFCPMDLSNKNIKKQIKKYYKYKKKECIEQIDELF